MNNLVSVIGAAPSEDPEGFIARLRVERLRVSEGLQAIRERRMTIGRGKAKAASKKKTTPKLSSQTISLLEDVDDLEDFFKFAKAEMEKEK